VVCAPLTLASKPCNFSNFSSQLMLFSIFFACIRSTVCLYRILLSAFYSNGSSVNRQMNHKVWLYRLGG
ncbi:MAG: hypothetical protein WA783_21595, partial [Phormidesmis sp.]